MIVAGDSKVTIDWINSKSSLNQIYLNYGKDKAIKFMHIHRQFNKVAHILSKEILKGSTGWLYYEVLVDGTVIDADKLYILSAGVINFEFFVNATICFIL